MGEDGKRGSQPVAPSVLTHQNFATFIYVDSNLNHALVRF